MALPPPADDATVVVTGASSGIGRALAEELARRGHHVTLIARRRDRLHELAEGLAADHGVRAEAIGADLSSARSRARAVRTVREGGLRVSGVCNNAGVGGYGVFHEMGEEHLGRLVALNVNAVHELALAFVPAMVERGAGAVLNVASILGHGPVPRLASYTASKAVVVTLSEALRVVRRHAPGWA